MQKTTIIAPGGQRYKINLRDGADESVLNEVFKFREYRAADEIIRNALNPIIDVGAQAGFFVLYARSLNPTVPILAIEPARDNVAALGGNLKANSITGVEVIAGALAARSGQQKLVIAQDNHNHYLATDQVAPDAETKLVTVYSLSDILQKYKVERVSLLKMDIEGGEYEVFSNLSQEDFDSLDNIIMEYHNYNGHNYKELESELREGGFGVQVFPSKFDKQMGFILARNKKIK